MPRTCDHPHASWCGAAGTMPYQSKTVVVVVPLSDLVTASLLMQRIADDLVSLFATL
jgi:hypothetical protein